MASDTSHEETENDEHLVSHGGVRGQMNAQQTRYIWLSILAGNTPTATPPLPSAPGYEVYATSPQHSCPPVCIRLPYLSFNALNCGAGWVQDSKYIHVCECVFCNSDSMLVLTVHQRVLSFENFELICLLSAGFLQISGHTNICYGSNYAGVIMFIYLFICFNFVG